MTPRNGRKKATAKKATAKTTPSPRKKTTRKTGATASRSAGTTSAGDAGAGMTVHPLATPRRYPTSEPPVEQLAPIRKAPDWITKSYVIEGGTVSVERVGTTDHLTIQPGRGMLNETPVSWSVQAITLTDYGKARIALTEVAPNTLEAKTFPTLNGEELPLDGNSPRIMICRTEKIANQPLRVLNCQWFKRESPRGSIDPEQVVQASVVTSGRWRGAVRQTPDGDNINWYFSNLGLYPFTDILPTIVRNHLAIQIDRFYGSNGTGEPNWRELHCYDWDQTFKYWPYDIESIRGNTPMRADSHGAYAGVFLRLAARYARTAPGGMSWWDRNVEAFQNAMEYNILKPRDTYANMKGTWAFQDRRVYPRVQVMDCMEMWRGAKDALELMDRRSSDQQAWAAQHRFILEVLETAIGQFWSDGPNRHGETGWLGYAWDMKANPDIRMRNDLEHFYPDLYAPMLAFIMDCPLHPTNYAEDQSRRTKCWARLAAKAPDAFQSRNHDFFPFGYGAAAAAKTGGMVKLVDQWYDNLELNHLVNGSVQIHDVGWYKYIKRVQEGERLS